MRRFFIPAIMISVMAIAAGAAQAAVEVPGADRIGIGNWYEADILVDGKAGREVKLISGKLPFGLRVENGRKVRGYPAGIERTAAVLQTVSDSGEAVRNEVEFAVVDEKFRLVYRELPVVKTGEQAEVKIEGQGGEPPYSGCSLARVSTFRNGGAAVPGKKRPAVDTAPSWLSISEDCTISASPDEEAIVLMIVSAKDSAGAVAKEFYALRAADDPAAQGWLEQKAREYNKDYQERFSPYGLTLEIDGKGAYHSYGDSAIWTGTYLAGAAYYYAVTGEEYAKLNMEKALHATTRLREITGVPGLIARAYENDEWVGRSPEPHIKPAPAEHRYEVTEGPYKGWRFLSTASRDQFTGVFWGNATVWDLFDEPAYREEASNNIVSMASHIWDNEMHIMEADGKHTRHGVMSGYGIQDSSGEKSCDPYTNGCKMANGFNAALILNWFNMAATVAGDRGTQDLWRERYRNLVMKEPNPEKGREFENNYTGQLKKVYVYGEAFIEYWETTWFNLNLLYNNYFHLTRFEKVDKLRTKYRETLEWLWQDKKEMADGCERPEARRTERERNPHFTWQYLAARGDRDPDKIFNALAELIAFPKGPRAPFDVADDVKIATVPGHDDWACEPVPIEYRKPADFQWQREPYSVFGSWPWQGDGRNFPGADVITPYWMGRYFGYIPSGI